MLWVAMVVLMTMGYSSQPFWIDVFDSVIAAILVSMNVILAHNKIDPAEEDDDRPQLEFPNRMRWLLTYLALTIVLISLMGYQIQNLPVIG